MSAKTEINHSAVSNSVVMYLRMLTSAQIKLDAESYAPFLFNPETTEPMEPESFCNNFVEAFGKEAGTAAHILPACPFGANSSHMGLRRAARNAQTTSRSPHFRAC